jgi:L-seryl-tRNA(Ser) seleniumtransferase
VPDPELEQRLRKLPSVEELLRSEPLRSAVGSAPRALVVRAAQEAIAGGRSAVRDGEPVLDAEQLARRAADTVQRLRQSSLRRVVNATGVVVHTNLGRAPLSERALAAVSEVARGYSNLEYDLERGVRGSRHAHVERLICELTGAEAAIAVNNNAAAVLLALAALASGGEVVISRGQLVEIGGSFRIPEILAASGARLVEVGTTNRTRVDDYEHAIGDETAALMRVHASNFRTVGFTEDVSIAALCELARSRGLAMIDDLGSGVLAAPDDELLASLVAEEPSARRSLEAGADVVCFSGDKLLGGPQAGLIAGRREAIDRLRTHPLARALRIDKLSLAALEATLTLYRDPAGALKELPVLAMLVAPEEELEARALRLRDAIEDDGELSARVEIVRASGRVGGGALPLLELEGPVVSVVPLTLGLEELLAKLRANDPPVVARAHDGALLLDPRTMPDQESALAAAAVRRALD